MVQIGDLVKTGIYTEPGIVSKINDDGTVLVDTEPLSIFKYHRYLNTSGLTSEEKEKYNTILDQIYSKENDMDKLNSIQQEIDTLEKDPGSGNIIRYLRNQQSVLIRSTKESPRFYSADEKQLKS